MKKKKSLDLGTLLSYLIEVEILRRSFNSNDKMSIYLWGKSTAVREIIKLISGEYIKIGGEKENVLQSIDLCKNDCKNNEKVE